MAGTLAWSGAPPQSRNGRGAEMVRIASAYICCALAFLASAHAAVAGPPRPSFARAAADTIPLAGTWADTVVVEGPRVSIAEVVRRIGERMAADEERMGSHAWTRITRVIARPREGDDGERDRTEYEVVERVRVGREGDVQQVRVRQVERRFKGGVLATEKVDDEVESHWNEIAATTEVMPFALEGDAYTYEIAGRHLVEDHLIYEVRFAPRSRFAALPSGTVWLDWSDYVIRRLEASFRDVVPMPLFLRAIPWVSVQRERCGAFWVVGEVSVRVELQGFWPGVPAWLEIHSRMIDHEIAGVPCEDLPAAPADTTTASEAGGYWGALDARLEAPLTPAMREAPAVVAVDSLTAVGRREMQDLLGGKRWRTTLSPLARVAFNRCEGLRPGFAVRHRQLVRHGTVVEAGLGYGIARERFVWDVDAEVPLAVAVPRDAAGQPNARSWPWLSLELRGHDRVVPFGGETDLGQTVGSFLFGDDPLMYHAARGGGATLQWRPRPDLALRGGWFHDDQRPLPVATRWSLLGIREDVPPNRAADRVVTRTATLDATWTRRRQEVVLGLERHRLDVGDAASPVADGTLWTFHAGLRAGWLTRQGHEVALRARWRRHDRLAPVQARHWLGRANALRGYPLRELEGDDTASASLDLRGGFDPLRVTGVPLLSRLGLQPIVFADWGWARRSAGSSPFDGDTGWRTDIGAGVGRLIGTPGSRGQLRFYAAKPVGNGEGDRPWQFLLLLEP